jgi:integrase
MTLWCAHSPLSQHTPPYRSSSSDSMADRQQWEVEAIVDRRSDVVSRDKGKHEYRVHWKGFPRSEDTWEPASSLIHCQQLVSDFEARGAACAAAAVPEQDTEHKRKRKSRNRSQQRSSEMEEMEQPAAITRHRSNSVTAPAAAPRKSAEDAERELQQWLQDSRNANTTRTYDSNMRQFVAWAEGPGSAELLVPIDAARPTQAQVAAYMRYMVMQQQRPMSTVGLHLSAIANHVRFVSEEDYSNPTRDPLIKAMKAVLTDYAPRPGAHQKKALDWDTLNLLQRTIAEHARKSTSVAGQWLGQRDWAMFLMAFFFLLRRSEVTRMRRQDVCVMQLATGERVLQVYVHEKSKNDRERRGHTRVAAARPRQAICVMRTVAQYVLACEQSTPRRLDAPDDPLFPRMEGGAMAGDTPNGRLQHWLSAAGVAAPTSYGFHSLRAGAATDAYRNGATEDWIKQHGNWKSDAVKIYIRQGIEEQLATTAVLGQGGSRAAAAAAAGCSL